VDLTSTLAETYLWSTGDTIQTIRVKTTGNFFVQVTDVVGCRSLPSVPAVVTVHALPPAPSITVEGSTDVCEHDSVILTASAGTAYLWSTGDTSRSIAVSIAGDYTVQALNSLGCPGPASDPVTITIRPAPAQPTVSFTGPTIFCEGDSLVLTSSAGTSYGWSTGETTPEIAARTSGSYTVRVANADGCFSLPSDPVDITVNPLPEKPVITGEDHYCTGDSTLLSGPAASTYLWSTGETTSTIYAKAGSYSLTVTDANGCSSPISDATEVTEAPTPATPVITPGGTIVLEPGDSVILTSSSATTYSWSPGGENTPSITVRSAGSYTVIVGNEYNCLSDPSDAVLVTQSGGEKPVITVTGGTDICDGMSTLLSAPEESGYLWSTGDTTQEITVTLSGSYTVTVYNDYGAPSPPSDPVDIRVFENPDLNLVNKSDVVCNGETSGSIEVIASGGAAPYTYTWNSGQSGSLLSNIGAGPYEVIAADANGCLDTLNTTITEPDAILITESITHPTCDESYDGAVEITVSGGTPGYTIQWSNTSTGDRTENVGPGTIDVTVTDASLCQESASFTLVAQNELCITVYEIITPNNDGHNDTWEITGIELYPNASIEVFDRWGRRVYFSQNGYPQPWDGTFNGKILPMDSYHYIIKLDNKEPIIGNITIVK
jgi:gliding motility-associated-like protein